MPRETLSTFPARLAELRQMRGLTQAALAERAGTSQPSIVLLEGGKRAPSLELAYRLAEALEVPFSAIVDQPGTPITRQKNKSRKNTD